MKKNLRNKHICLRRSFKEAKKKEADRKILSRLMKLPVLEKAEKIMVYVSVKGEPDTLKLIEKLIESGKKVYAPRIEDENIVPFRLKNTAELEPGLYKIPQPPPGEKVAPENIDLVVVPGLCFTSTGLRLGRGGGYYDRFLVRLPEETATVGLCYSFGIEESLPCERHDIKVKKVITEKLERRK